MFGHHMPHLGFYWYGVWLPNLIVGVLSLAITGAMACGQFSNMKTMKIKLNAFLTEKKSFLNGKSNDWKQKKIS